MNKLNLLSMLVASTMITSISVAQSPIFPPAGALPYMPQQQTYPSGFYPPAYGQMPPQIAPPKIAPQSKKAVREYSGYLGLSIDIIPPSVRAQLPAGVTQGILVKEFAPDSPALNSELKPFDVIYSYAGTNLNHPSQFIKLVRNDKPGKTVMLKVVQKGQVKEIPITLGAQKTPNPKEFNGLAIKQIGKDKYNALIRFVGTNGNKQMRSYKGTRQEIFEQAMNAQDLPDAERKQLLFATRPRQGQSNSGFGSFFPFGGKNESGKDWMNPSRFFKW